MDPEFAELIPLFLEESRDRLDRIASLLPRLSQEPDSLVEIKRELHTLKGAGRMMQLGTFAELCHAGEEVLHASRPGAPAPPGVARLLTRTVDRLGEMLEGIAHTLGAEELPADPELLAALRRAAVVPGAGPEVVAAPPPRQGAEPPASPGGGARVETPPPGAGSAGAASYGATSAGGPATGSVSESAGLANAAAGPVPPLAGASPSAGGPVRAAGPAGLSASRGVAGRALPPAGPLPRQVLARGDIRVEAAALDAVAERATQVRIMALAGRQTLERIYELGHLAEDGLHEPQPGQVLAVLATMLRRLAVELEGGQRRLIRSAEDQLETMLALQMQPLRGPFQALARYARELARHLRREVEVELAGEDTRLDRRIASELEEAFLHLVRNAVDHGVESPEIREARGKPPAGRIRISALADGARVRLSISDDGSGIDPRRVLQQAVESGLVESAAGAAMGRDEVLRLLFAPGFSTRRRVSETSGRGVGLDVVASAANRVGGDVFLTTEPRQGTTITLDVPVARRGEHVLLLRVGQLRVALPGAVVRRATRLGAGAVLERDGRALARLGDRLVPFVPLSRLYGQPLAEGQLLLEGLVSGQSLALAVDDVEGEEEVLVRPLSRKFATDRLLEGIALLASGEPVGVLSPAVLAQREYLRSLPVAEEHRAQRKVRVLLVDDSLVTREMERRLLEDAGFEVAAAGDAPEALSRLAEASFDCVVTDIEMPSMDGFELTAQLRSMEHFAHLPIVVVSTRDRPEDRLRGLKAGADAYLTKQSLDAGELVDLVQRLSGR